MEVFGSRRGPVLGGQTPPISIIPEVPVSKLFPILVRRASLEDFGWGRGAILDDFWGVREDFEAFFFVF